MMKRIMPLVAALLAMLSLTSFMTMRSSNGKDSRGHELCRLWKEYDRASNAGRPDEQCAILERIKKQAMRQRLPLDYYDACDRYVSVKSGVNWKLRRQLLSDFKKEIVAYGEPVLYVVYAVEQEGELQEYVADNAKRLRASRTPALHKAFSPYGPWDTGYGEMAVSLMRNDYEYALWMLLRHGKEKEAENAWKLLETELDGRYPESVFAQYDMIGRVRHGAELHESYRMLAEKYAGKAVSLFPLKELMLDKFRSMEGKASSDDYLAFRETVRSYENERKMYRNGIDAAIARDFMGFAEILEMMEEKSVGIRMREGEAVLKLRNYDAVVLGISTETGIVVHKVRVENPSRSFYAYDTVRVELPALDDGRYGVKCLSDDKPADDKNCIYSGTYVQNRISLALRRDADGYRAYAADYMSGEPVGKADLVLYKGDREIARAEDVLFDGFTPLPSSLEAVMKGGESSYRLSCSCRDISGRLRSSREMHFYDYHRDRGGISVGRISAAILKDRAAFRLGDTLKFKGVLYNVGAGGNMSVLPSGREVEARLCDARGEIVARQVLRTNMYGSVAGEFALDVIKRNGMCCIELLAEGNVVGTSSFRADDFVLPTFDLAFDKREDIYFVGDTVAVSGKVVNYSGHPLSGVSAEYTFRVNGSMSGFGQLVLGEDGRFIIKCPTEKNDRDFAAIEINVRLTDATGETREFTCVEHLGASPSVNAVFSAEADGRFELGTYENGYNGSVIIAEEKTDVICEVLHPYGGGRVKAGLEYELLKNGQTITAGDVSSGGTVTLDFEGQPSGLYEFVLAIPDSEYHGQQINRKVTYYILKVRDGESLYDSRIVAYFRVADTEDIVLDYGCGDAPVWAAAELFDDKARLLDSRLVLLEPLHGDRGRIGRLKYEYLPEYPDVVVLNVIYFKNGKRYDYSREWTRRYDEDELALDIATFTDKAYPGALCSVTLKTEPGAEIAASVFDVSTENIMSGRWGRICRPRTSAGHVYINAAVGECAMARGYDMMYASSAGNMAGGRRYKNSVMTRDAVSGDMDYIELQEEEFVLSDSSSPAPEAGGAGEGAPVREDFAPTVAFVPFLYSSDDGSADFKFRASDKLSTFVVQMFAHDKAVRTAVARKEMLVTLPLKVSVAEPQFLTEGDRYVMNAVVSNSSGRDISGGAVFGMYAGARYEGVKPLVSSSENVTVPAGGTVKMAFEVPVPELKALDGARELGFKVVFSGDDGVSDGIFVTVPVYPAGQVVVEAHSAVLLPGMSVEALADKLRGQFINMSAAGAECCERNLYEMLMEAVPGHAETGAKDVISLSETLYLNLLSSGLRGEVDVAGAMEIVSKMLACANSDGGFGWFEGMVSSPAVTAVVLGRYALMRDRGLLESLSARLGEDDLDDLYEAVSRAVKYLDESFFGGNGRPVWYGALSLEQYLYVRSFYSGVAFDEAAAVKAMGEKKYSVFRKSVNGYLVPSKERGMNGYVLGLARRMRILYNLGMSEQGTALVKAWGVNRASAKLGRSLENDLVSLMQYAVEHPSGGWYYPNAVMPWRGLLESEAYAHAVICDLLDDLSGMQSCKGDGKLAASIADGIRIWIMLQKDTQQWTGEPGFVEAIASVCAGGKAMRETKVIVLKKRALKPFSEILPAGNGFGVSVKYYKETPGDGLQEIRNGARLNTGDRIVAKYSVRSDENRSFVRLTVPRSAALLPVQQLSGWTGGWFRPVMSGSFSISPAGYREVRSDRTLYWFDVFPEEESEISEEFFVTSEGTFAAAAPEIESLYAPHYRANSSAPASVSVD